VRFAIGGRVVEDDRMIVALEINGFDRGTFIVNPRPVLHHSPISNAAHLYLGILWWNRGNSFRQVVFCQVIAATER
jgi:hypothetical protein